MKIMRQCLLMGAVISAGMLVGCSPVPPQTQPSSVAAHAQSQPVRKFSDAPVLGEGPVARGVFIAIDTRAALTAEAEAKARLTREQVLTLVKLKALAPATTTAPSTVPTTATAQAVADAGDAEPPPQAVKYYLQGRQLFLEGANTQAMAALEQALQLDPNGFTVLRLMGRVCFAAQQLPRGAMYLQRAQAIRPHDVEVNYLLGRYWLERNDWDRAAYFLMAAQDSPERLMTSTQTPLSAFYLSIALQQGGYHFAAAREYEHFLDLSERPIAGYRYDGELNYLLNMQWATHLAAAENDARVGNYHTALPHYRAAADARRDDPFIASRLINALARDGQRDAAQQAGMAQFAASKGSEDALRLLAWTYQGPGEEKRLLADLTTFLKSPEAQRVAASDSQKTIILAAALEHLGNRAASIDAYHKHLAAHPADMEVLGRLLKAVETGEAFGRAMQAAAGAIAADKRKGEEIVRQYLRVAEGPGGAAWEKQSGVARLDGPSDATQRLGALKYLEAVAHVAQRAPAAKIEQAYEASLKAWPDMGLARESYVAFLLNQEMFARAASLIDAVVKENPANPKAWSLQIESEAAQQRFVAAQQLATEAKAKFPADVEIRMRLVAVLRLRGLDRVADQELQALIQDSPAYEPAYQQLVNSLFRRMARGDAAANLNAIVAALNKLASALPDSQFGRIMSALIYARAGRGNDAEGVLKGVLAAEPDNADALVLLAQLWQREGRGDQSAALLESALRRKSQVDVVRALAGTYRDTDRKGDALALARRHMEANADAEAYVLLYAGELVAQEQQSVAAGVLADAIKHFPRSQPVAVMLARLQEDMGDHDAAIQTIRSFMQAAGQTSDRYYLLSNFYSLAGNHDAAVAALQQVLAIMPDHVGANNDLGYFWANAGIHIDQAEPMIRKALENKPDDPAFIDSLGWLYYKQGKFAEARTQLERALSLPGGSSPEVVRHLADALYRLGLSAQAIERWAQAEQMLGRQERLNANDRKEKQYLSDTLTAARAGREPAVSPLAEPSGAKAAVPANTPATLPR